MQDDTLLDLFPEIEPYATGYLDVGSGHQLYWEQSGNPDGVPVVLLHGGPGAGASPKHRRFFDPDHYRIIIFDQRGAGRSTPLGELKDNTLAHLIEDMEKLRAHLNVKKWHLFGGSWGSTLGLAYGVNYPENCLGMVLRGIFLFEQSEIDWFLHGMGKFYPEVRERFVGHIPENERDNLMEAYCKRLLETDDESVQMDAALQWCQYEGSCASMGGETEIIETPEERRHALTIARIEAHYFRNQVIAPENSLLKQAHKLAGVPGVIVHGRFDMICPIESAYKLHKAWPGSHMFIVPDAGHSSLDPGLRSRLIEASESMKRYG